MKNLYEVTALKSRRLKGAHGCFTAADDYVVHKSYQVASSESEAIEIVKTYHITPGTRYDSIRASFVREA
jgi:hypothetical protein